MKSDDCGCQPRPLPGDVIRVKYVVKSVDKHGNVRTEDGKTIEAGTYALHYRAEKNR